MKPCPFCGSEQGTSSSQTLQAVDGKARAPELLFVTCVDCGARGPVTFDMESAQRLWDARGSWHVGDRVLARGCAADIKAGPFVEYEVCLAEHPIAFHVREGEIERP